MIRGRRRRYFGYPKDLAGYIETPESAKSFATHSTKPSITSSINVAKLNRRRKSVNPDPELKKRYADDKLQKAIATQIPALLPPLKNTYRFKELEDNPIYFHHPRLESHFERSLYYIWLSKNDRGELCRIVDAHLGSRGNLNRSSEEYREIGNPIHRPIIQADYSHMPRTMSVLDDDMRLKFQRGLWDPPKTPRDRFVRDHHGKSPAMETICHAYPGNQKTRVNERDIQDCLLAAKRLLGPYSGINTSFLPQEDFPDSLSDLIQENNRIEKIKVDTKKANGISKRPFGYNSTQIQYDRQISVAMDYFNKIKTGVKNLIPPAEIFGNLKKLNGKSVANIALESNNEGARKSIRRSGFNQKGKKKFMKDKVTEEDYMEMYVHYLGEEEDLSIKKPIRSLTDITKLKIKMNLDNNVEPEHDYEINELLRNDSFSDLKDPVIKRLVKGEIDPFKAPPPIQSPPPLILKDTDNENEEKVEIVPQVNTYKEDSRVVEEILKSHFKNIKNPRLRDIFAKLSKPVLANKRNNGVKISAISSTTLSDAKVKSEETVENEKLEKELGFVDYQENAYEILEMEDPEFRESMANVLTISSPSDSNSVGSSINLGSQLIPGWNCKHNDVECLDEAGALGTPPFESKIKLLNAENLDPNNENDDDKNLRNTFSVEYWTKQVLDEKTPVTHQ